MTKQLSLLVALLVVFSINVSASLISAALIGPSPDELAVPSCSPANLAHASSLFATNDLKKQCETTLNIAEMLHIEVQGVKKLCGTKSCMASFEQLYNTIPACRIKDWPIKLNFKRVLEHCGVGSKRRSSRVPSHGGKVATEKAKLPGDSSSFSSSSPSGSDVNDAVGGPTTKMPDGSRLRALYQRVQI